MKYLLIILLVLVGFVGKAQLPWNTTPTQFSTGYFRQGWHRVDSGSIYAVRDTNFIPRYVGTTVYWQHAGVDTAQWIWNGLRWIKNLTTFIQSPTIWGSITGTLSNQADLQNALNLKFNTTDTTNKWVQDVYVRNDSLFKFKNGTETFLDTLGGGGGGSGTVTSVALSMPSAFSVTGSPITTSGTFNISGAGTALEYIRGNGTLATTDTGMIPSFYSKVRGLLSGTSPITYNNTTGAIGINNANASGTKGAATFNNSDFSDNGSGTISLSTLVAAGSCTGCVLNIDTKGRITGYSDGAGGATNNTNIGSGFRPVNVTTQEMRTYFAGFGQRLDSVANANGLTWSADTTRGSGIPTYFYADSLFDSFNILTNSGISKSGDTVQLGATSNSGVPLNHITYINTDVFRLIVEGTNPSGNILEGINTGTGSGIYGSSINSYGINGNSTDLYGVYGVSSISHAIHGWTTNGNTAGYLENNAASTNTVLPTLQLKRTTEGTAGAGIGSSIEWYVEKDNGASNTPSHALRSILTDPANGNEDGQFELYGVNNASFARIYAISSTGQWTWDGYPALTPQTDTTNIKPIGYNTSTGLIEPMANWVGSGGGSGTNNTNLGSAYRWLNEGTQTIKTVADGYGVVWDSTSTANSLTAKVDTTEIATQYDLEAKQNVLVSDIGRLQQIKTYMPALGAAASATYSASYPAASVDTAYFAYTTTGVGTENGGWLAAGTSGDSIQVTAPFGVVFGNSIMEGHPGRHGRLHPLVGGVPQNTFIYNYPDSTGQVSYHLRALTNMRWYNHGIGGQTTVDMRKRFMRDVIGDSVPNMTDGRGNQTLKQRPQIVIIEGGINDIFNGVAASVTQANLEWMAATCQQYNVRCVMLNIPGDASANQSQLRLIASMNEWFKSGVMDQYNVGLVDFNLWWNDPDYGGDNIHPTSLIVDGIHPSLVGYDSLANYIYRSVKLPVLTKAVFVNELSPLGFTGYSRPVDITINGDPYSLAALTDSINITSFVPDSVWIKINSSTNVTGTTYTGFSHILWKIDNNVLDSTFFTRRTYYNNSVSYPSLSGIDIIASKPSNNTLVSRIRMNDLNETFRALTSGGGGTFIFNGLSNTTALNNATISIYNSGGNAIGSNGSIIATGGVNQFGNLELRNNAAPTTTGYGIGTASTASSLTFYGTGSQGRDLFRFSTWNGASSNMNNTSQMSFISLVGVGFALPANPNSIGNSINIQPAINITGTSKSGTQIRGIRYSPVMTSDSSTRHYGLFIVRGNNYLNIAGDSTCFGCDSAAFINARFRVNGSVRIDSITAPPSTYNVLVHGLTDSIVYQVPASTFGGISTLNTLTAATQTFATGTSGTDFNISSSTSTHTFNIPSASASNRGLVTTASQTFAGAKTFTTGIIVNNTGQAAGVDISGNRSSSAAPGVAGITLSIPAFTYTSSAGAGTETQGQNFNVFGSPTLTSSNAITYTGNVVSALFSGAPIAGGSSTIEHPYTIYANDVSRLAAVAFSLNEQSGDATIGSASGVNIYTGAGGHTFTLPALATHPGKIIFIKNAGGGNLTVARAGSDNIYDTSSVTSITVAAGASAKLMAGSLFWYVLN